MVFISNTFSGSGVTYKVTTKTSDIAYAGTAGVEIQFHGHSENSHWKDLRGDYYRGDKRTRYVSGGHFIIISDIAIIY